MTKRNRSHFDPACTAMRRWVVVLTTALGLLMASPVAAADQSDAWITTKVKMALIASADVKGLEVNVDTTNGLVTLHGTVATEAEKTQAEALARKIESVRDVRNLLQVISHKAEAEVAEADDKIRAQVENTLSRDGALADSKVQVASVHNGVVVLAGRAATLSDHRRALEDARSVPGVRQVASEIESPNHLADEEIWSEESSGGEVTSSAKDIRITTAAKVRLLANAGISSALDINVDTRQGVVTLFGIVPSDEAKALAEHEVEKVSGVKAVVNELQVVEEAAQEIVKANDARVEEALESRIAAKAELKDAAIDVDVKDGVARLSGTVRGQGDRMTALTLARATEGVRSVVDDLEVKAAFPAVSSAEHPAQPTGR